MRAPPRPDVWCHRAVVVQPSCIAGDGLFSTVSIDEGELVLRLGGALVTTTALAGLIADADETGRYVDTVTVFDDAHLVLPDNTIAHFVNHGCDPNLWHDGPYDITARRVIEAGEELTIDYGTNSGAPGFEMACTCGAASCRHRITSDDWMLPDLGRRYRGHWVPALAHRIEHA